MTRFRLWSISEFEYEADENGKQEECSKASENDGYLEQCETRRLNFLFFSDKVSCLDVRRYTTRLKWKRSCPRCCGQRFADDMLCEAFRELIMHRHDYAGKRAGFTMLRDEKIASVQQKNAEMMMMERQGV